MVQEPHRDRPEQDRNQRQVLDDALLNLRRRFPRTASPRPAVVRQRGGNDCGLAALATVAAYHGSPLIYERLMDEAAAEPDGTDLLTLSRLAEALGFQTQGVKAASYEAMATCSLPAIAHFRRRLRGGHFVVVQRWTPEHVLIADPATGRQKLSRGTFCRRATGYLLLAKPRPHEG